MTLVEILVVVGVIAFLSGILLAALTAIKGSGEMAKSMNRMRQIAVWMQGYASDNRETILPSRFDYSANPHPGQVRSAPNPTLGDQYEGTWSDILWTVNEVGSFPGLEAGLGHDYRYDSPDTAVYAELGDYDQSPFRAAAPNRDQVAGGSGPRPFGCGAQEIGEPGYFAANDFFNARPDAPGATAAGRWIATGQIRAPDRGLYLVDSFAGEIIGGEADVCDGTPIGAEADFDFSAADAPGTVDFRYNGICLILFLDGHQAQEAQWTDIDDLEGDPGDPTDHGRGIRIRNLTR